MALRGCHKHNNVTDYFAIAALAARKTCVWHTSSILETHFAKTDHGAFHSGLIYKSTQFQGIRFNIQGIVGKN